MNKDRLNNGAQYMLRRNLALWNPKETIRETLEFCRFAGVGEIIWKIDPEDFSHGFTPLELIRKYLLFLEKAREMSRKKGVLFSINPWLTLNHTGRQRYPDGPPDGFHWRVKPDGSEDKERACSLSPGWQEWFFEAYRLYATTRPDKLWLEDDFKTFPAGGGADVVKIGCFCENHLRQFAGIIKQEIDRESLVRRLIAPGPPDPVRRQWFDFQAGIMVDLCRRVEKIVHQESPETRLGIMQSWSTDGRWWSDAITAVAGPHRPLSRTSLAPYEEGRASEFLPDRFDVLKEMACLPPNTENCPELENTPYTPYSKSMRMTRLQILMSFLLGNTGITMNLFDMVGTPTSEDPRVGKMLKELKPLLDGIVSLTGANGVFQGLSVPYPKRYADFHQARTGGGFDDIFRFDGDGWLPVLQACGFPVVLNGSGPVTVVTGQSLRAVPGPEIESLLRQGLLLDGSAAAALGEMGFAEQIGVRASKRLERRDILLSAERDDWKVAGKGRPPVYMSLANLTNPFPGRLFCLFPKSGARVISRFVNPDHQDIMTGFTLFENGLGGRVAVYPFDLSLGSNSCFMNWTRRRQVQRIVRWLAREEIALMVDGGAWMMPLRRDCPGYILLAVLNFETDDWEKVVFTFRHPAAPGKLDFQVVSESGRLQRIKPESLKKKNGNITAVFNRKVLALDGLVLKVTER